MSAFTVVRTVAVTSLPFEPWLSQLCGSFLLAVGVWVLVDPMGFREIVAANPLLFTGVYVILAMGGMLFLLGFLGCCGAIRENKCLLLFVSQCGGKKFSNHYVFMYQREETGWMVLLS